MRIVFVDEAEYKFKLECSLDQETWTPIGEVGGSFKEKVVPMDGKFEGLFFRITFAPGDAGKPGPAVSEFEIML